MLYHHCRGHSTKLHSRLSSKPHSSIFTLKSTIQCQQYSKSHQTKMIHSYYKFALRLALIVVPDYTYLGKVLDGQNYLLKAKYKSGWVNIKIACKPPQKSHLYSQVFWLEVFQLGYILILYYGMAYKCKWGLSTSSEELHLLLPGLDPQSWRSVQQFALIFLLVILYSSSLDFTIWLLLFIIFVLQAWEYSCSGPLHFVALIIVLAFSDGVKQFRKGSG